MVDSKEVNAFAVPGGYVYVNRGLIERATNMDELAGVLGHEIGHVVLRHSVKQMQQAQGANVGLTLACVLTRVCQNQAAGAAIQIGGSALFAKFSRDDEAQADRVGVKYVTRAGIDPHGMPQMFQTLLDERKSQAGGGRRMVRHPPAGGGSPRRHAGRDRPDQPIGAAHPDHEYARVPGVSGPADVLAGSHLTRPALTRPARAVARPHLFHRRIQRFRMHRHFLGSASFFVLAAAAGLPPHTAAAQFAPSPASRPVSFGIQGGLTVPTGDLGDVTKTGWNVGGYVQYRQPEQVFGLRGEVLYNRSDFTDQFLLDEGGSVGSTGHYGFLSFGGDGVLEVSPQGSGVGWYLLAGPAMYRVEPSYSEQGITVSSNFTKLGFNAGGGLRFHMGGASLFVEGRYHTVSNGSTHFQFFPVSVGLSW